jgi:hypothetical protein
MSSEIVLWWLDLEGRELASTISVKKVAGYTQPHCAKKNSFA